MMNNKRTQCAVLLCSLVMAACLRAAASSQDMASDAIRESIIAAAEAPHRSLANKARDQYRNPVETLLFFGLRADMKVVEVWPGAGWYTEILALVLRERGELIVANFPEDAQPAFRARIGREFLQKLGAEPEVYSNVYVINFDPPGYALLSTPESADMVLLSRHFHNIIRAGITDDILNAAFGALKPGGVLAVVQHRAAEDAVPESQQRTGYVREAYVIERAEAAGFVLDARSEINANPRDSHDHPAGVWSLPPSLRYCAGMDEGAERAVCEERYRAIGESDRMTLRFIKPR